jgi:predicted RND superfamily exporter protein
MSNNSISRKEKLVKSIENLIFLNREIVLSIFIVISLVLAAASTKLEIQAGFNKMIPMDHEYMQAFKEYENTFGGANKIMVAIKTSDGDIYSNEFLKILKNIHEDVFFLSGVERASVQSLFSSSSIYLEVTEDGFRGGPVLPNNFNDSQETMNEFRSNLLKSDLVGRIVGSDFKSAMVAATLRDEDATTGKQLDVKKVGAELEKIRSKYETGPYSIHIIGFAKSASDIAAGAQGVLIFFLLAFMVTAALLLWYTKSIGLSFWALSVALIPVVWLLGLLPIMGMSLDPMSILVPFLIFSIGVSHAVQMCNAWKMDVIAGNDSLSAARASFKKLFIPGASALLANAVGFMVIALVNIEIVRELALTATIGVTLMIFTNKLLLPILLSYIKVNKKSEDSNYLKSTKNNDYWAYVSLVATKPYALATIAAAIAILGVGVWEARQLHVGDMGRGVPELRPESRYNKDIEVISNSFAVGIDDLSVVAESPKEGACVDFQTLETLDRFEFYMKQHPAVQSVRGMAGFVKNATAGYSEGDIKWAVIPDTQQQRAQSAALSTRGFGSDLSNRSCSAMLVSLFASDHQASTIKSLINDIKTFKDSFDTDELKLRLATGSLGVMAATNEAVEAADKWVNLTLFISVGLLCLLTFRSVPITLCIILPLGLSVVLCNALMAVLGIGLKVNTLPVVALGVGVGVDYGIYLFEVMRHEMEERKASLRDAFLEALKQRGTASLFTALTLTIGVATWVFSDLKFQADMGILLAFMFVVNLIGALLLTSALAAFIVPNKSIKSK